MAQVNIARAVTPLEAPAMDAFVARIEEINRLADQSPGFVWRYTGSATAVDLAPLADYVDPFEPDRLLFNLSVWHDVDSLSNYIYKSAHVELIRAKRQWFLPLDRPFLALWWIPNGSQPTIVDAAHRLKSLDKHGPTQFAFSLRKTFPAP